MSSCPPPVPIMVLLVRGVIVRPFPSCHSVCSLSVIGFDILAHCGRRVPLGLGRFISLFLKQGLNREGWTAKMAGCQVSSD